MSGQAMCRSDHQGSDAPAPGTGNRQWLASILNAQRAGKSCLPFHLGLSEKEFDDLVATHFSERTAEPMAVADPARLESDALRQELLELRRDEWAELRDLLVAGRAGLEADEIALASVVAAACLGGDHLWRDLGLGSRLALHQLLLHNFPSIAQRNVHDMRWKKFFYKQLCEQDGGYVCRSPSCEQCPTYHDCFGDES